MTVKHQHRAFIIFEQHERESVQIAVQGLLDEGYHITDSFTQPPEGEQGYYDLKCETTNEVKAPAANTLTNE